jgi:S1-C subfamily serine protease
MLGGIVVGAIGAIWLLIHFGLAYLDKASGEASGLKELAQMDATREKAALQEERAAQAKVDAAKESERKKVRDQLSVALCGGDNAVADALLTALEQVEEEAMDAFNTGRLPPDLPAFMEEKFMQKLAESAVLRKFFGGSSQKQLARAFFGSMEQRAPTTERREGIALFASNKYGSMGTAFYISGDGWLMTNHHVVRNVSEVDIRTASGEILQARVMKTDPAADLALLKTPAAAPEWLPFSSGDATLGSSVFTVGYPRPTLQGVEPKFTDGTVSSLKGAQDDATNYQISVPIQPGNSGGALVHLQSGWVIGVIRAQIDPTVAQNVNYAIKSTAVRKLLEATPAAKFILNVPAPLNPPDASATIEKVKAATVLVLIPR